MAVNEDDQSLHEISTHSTHSKTLYNELNTSTHSSTSKTRNQGGEDAATTNMDEAFLYGLLGLKVRDSGLAHDNSGSLSVGSDAEASDAFGEEKSWKTMDSVHSRTSTLSHTCMSGNNEDSFNYDGSGDSFASFGDSKSDLSASVAEIKDTFTDLNEGPPPPRRTQLMKSSSMRFQRASSFRGTLSLIEEKEMD
jgi:hypothetical protein